MLAHDQDRFRRHKGACRFYRENWIAGPEERNGDGEVVLYEIHCLRGWPPTTAAEQHTCMLSPTHCWRDNVSHHDVLAHQDQDATARVS